ncbi:Elongation factor 1-alpha [Phytophthora palmivora]|uniref:Elongation factor 1-alpha n=1 Tax=Phytophthora palmivora TaxID=4796 RepID=A0A2P4Y5N2_9STRA|nr:Elongation factor 1-alpha [Phytophthora palmivora]
MLQSDAIQAPAVKLYENVECQGTAVFVGFVPDHNCDDYYLDQCFPEEGYCFVPDHNCDDYYLDQCFPEEGYSYSISCTDNYKTFTDNLFGNSPYLFTELYDDDTQCGTLNGAAVHHLDGICHGLLDTDTGVQVTLNTNKSVTILVADVTCSQLDSSVSTTIPSSAINSNECFEDKKFYSNAGTGSNTTTTATTGDASAAMTTFVAPTIAILLSVVAQTIFTL